MRWAHLVTLMDAEAARQEEVNDHSAAILLREAAEHIRAMHSCDAVLARCMGGDTQKDEASQKAFSEYAEYVRTLQAS